MVTPNDAEGYGGPCYVVARDSGNDGRLGLVLLATPHVLEG